MREEISLNFQWEFYRDVENRAIENNPVLKYEKQMVDLPHNNVMLPFNNFNEEVYQFKSLYRKIFVVHQNGKISQLHFLFKVRQTLRLSMSIRKKVLKI